jgi:hypothetical protein
LWGVETAAQGRKASGVEEGSIMLGFHRSQHEGGDMKKQALTLVGVLGLLLVAGSAFAQTRGTLLADVPFNFTVNRTTMPAGPYTISTMGTGNGVLLIQGQDSKAVKLVTANAAQAATPANRTKLVFHCYGGDHCFLYQIWVAGATRGQELPKGNVEREVAANINSRNVTVMASTR